MENNKRSHWKKRGTCDSFPKKLIIDKVEITDTKTIDKTFNNYILKIGPNLASKIPKSDTNFKAYISKATIKPHENPLAEDELLGTFNDTCMEKLCFTQFSTRTTAWLFLTIFTCSHNQLSSIHSIITY